MKAISIKQPWAWCIVNGHKPVENRDWSTRFRGPVLVHAGKSFDRDGYDWIKQQGLVPALPSPESFTRGGIVGVVTITDCVQEMASPWFFGKFGFVLANAKPLSFYPVRGQLGFFSVEHDDQPQHI